MRGKQNNKCATRKEPMPLSGKLKSMIQEKLPLVDLKRLAILNIPYVIVFYLVDKLAWLYRHCVWDSMIHKLTRCAT